jgi:phosphoglycerate dehydrogenase-like enzyme
VTSSVLVVVAGKDDRPPGLPPAGDPTRFTFAWDLAGVRRALPEAEVVLLWSFRTGLLQQAWPSATRLRWVHMAGAGVDATIFPELVASDVVLTNSRGVFDGAMAEYAMALMLAAAKDLPGTIALQARHDWRFRLTESLAGKRLVVVGPGSIGRAVARHAAAFGMEVTAVGRHARGGDADFQRVVGRDELTDALENLDRWSRGAPLRNVVDKHLGFVPS